MEICVLSAVFNNYFILVRVLSFQYYNLSEMNEYTGFPVVLHFPSASLLPCIQYIKTKFEIGVKESIGDRFVFVLE